LASITAATAIKPAQVNQTNLGFKNFMVLLNLSGQKTHI